MRTFSLLFLHRSVDNRVADTASSSSGLKKADPVTSLPRVLTKKGTWGPSKSQVRHQKRDGVSELQEQIPGLVKRCGRGDFQSQRVVREPPKEEE